MWLGVGGVGPIEETVVWDEVFVCVHHILHVLTADQRAVELRVGGRWKVHTLIPLRQNHRAYKAKIALN